MIGSLLRSFLWFSGPFLTTLLIYLFGLSWRIEFKGLSILKKYNFKVLYVFWHENMLPPLFTHRKRKVGVIVSPSLDGEFMSRILRLLGFKVFRGDTEKGGSKALIGLIKYGREGNEIAITPDGPKGPRRKVKKGVFLLARETSLPIIAVRVSSGRCFRFSSWDKFMLPYPFSKIKIELREILNQPKEETLEKYLS
ncbi:MAG: lysophospholipid acyltransferase family protein [candidate division WOR-3 bacterium]